MYEEDRTSEPDWAGTDLTPDAFHKLNDEIRCDEIVIEIKSIQKQTMNQLLTASVEIGRLLSEAKEKMPHGAWGGWLNDNFAYSQSTANNLMRLFENYGDANQLDMFYSSGERLEIFGNLTPSQALVLLKLPEDERREYVEEHDMEQVSVRELEADIKARLEAETKRADDAESRADDAESRADRNDSELREAQKKLNEVKDRFHNTIGELAEVRKSLEAERNAAKEKLKQELSAAKSKAEANANQKIKELEDRLEKQTEKYSQQLKDRDKANDKAIEDRLSSERSKIQLEVQEEYTRRIAEYEEKIASLEKAVNVAKVGNIQAFSAHFDIFKKEFETMCQIISDSDSQAREKFRSALSTACIQLSEIAKKR